MSAGSASHHELLGDAHCAGDLLTHDGGLDGVARVLADGEGAMVGHEDRRGPGTLQGLHDAAADRVVPDEGEGPIGMSPPNSSPIIVRAQGIGSRRAAHAVA